MLTAILNWLSAEIEVDVAPDRFVFKRNDTIQSLKTKIYLSDDSAKPSVLGVGDGYIPTQPNKRVALFKEDKEGLLPSLAKAECLEAYFRHAFRLVTGRYAFVRPKVVFKNSRSLKGLLCGYQSSILLSAAMKAGARECIFES